MVDPSDRGSESEEMMSTQTCEANNSNSNSSNCNSNNQIKTCADCGTTKTPLWRGGPAGPKSLCNACGIRSRKRRRALLGLNKDDKKTKKPASNNKSNTNLQQSNSNSTSSSDESGSSSSGGNVGISPTTPLKKRFLPFGRDSCPLQKPRSQQQRKKLGEVEKAAFLLMALSCGSVFA